MVFPTGKRWQPHQYNVNHRMLTTQSSISRRLPYPAKYTAPTQLLVDTTSVTTEWGNSMGIHMDIPTIEIEYD